MSGRRPVSGFTGITRMTAAEGGPLLSPVVVIMMITRCKSGVAKNITKGFPLMA